MVYTKIDLKNAYHSFKVHENSREILSFQFKNKTYCWKGCAFGLSSITSIFCRVMKILLGPIEGVESYVDDCVIASTPEKHAALVKKVLDILTDANLKINFDKTMYLKKTMYLLGFVVGPGVTTLDQRRLSNIDKWTIPKTASQVRHLMGLITSMRGYLPAIARLAGPLDQLRNDDDVKNKWSDDHTKRLEAIKEMLVSKAILHTYDSTKKLYVECDASLYGLGVALTQRDNLGRTLFIAFASKSLNKHERLWSTNRRETQAILFGLTRFRELILGNTNVEIQTDHRALTFLFTTPNLNRTLQHAMVTIAEFGNLSIVYKKGILNTLPDKLSRIYPPILEDQILEGEMDTAIKKLQDFVLVKRSEKTIKLLKDKNVFIKKPNKPKYSNDKELNILAIKLTDQEFKHGTTGYVAPPIDERSKLIEEYHIGHFGVQAVVKALLSEGLYWNTMYNDVKKKIKILQTLCNA